MADSYIRCDKCNNPLYVCNKCGAMGCMVSNCENGKFKSGLGCKICESQGKVGIGKIQKRNKKSPVFVTGSILSSGSDIVSKIFEFRGLKWLGGIALEKIREANEKSKIEGLSKEERIIKILKDEKKYTILKTLLFIITFPMIGGIILVNLIDYIFSSLGLKVEANFLLSFTFALMISVFLWQGHKRKKKMRELIKSVEEEEGMTKK